MVVTTRRAATAAATSSLVARRLKSQLLVRRVLKQKRRLQQQEERQNKQKRRNVFPIPFYESLCLVMSSCFFLLPGYYAFLENLPFHGSVSIVTTIVSANYWRYAVEGTRRNVDLIVAKVSFMIYCASGFWFTRDWRLYAVGIPGIT